MARGKIKFTGRLPKKRMRQKALSALLCAAFFFSASGHIFAARSESNYEKAIVTGNPEILSSGDRTIQKVPVKILTGKYRGLKTVSQTYLWDYEGYNLILSKGDKVILNAAKGYDGKVGFFIVSRYRAPYIYGALLLFVVLFFTVTGFKKKGAMVMVALNIFLVIPALFFIIKTGFNPVWGGIIICGAGILISVSVILGGGRKLYSALSGALIGSASSGVLTLVFMDYMKIEGRFAPGARMIQTASRYLPGWNINDLKGVVAAGIMIASLGAVIDIAVSMVSAMNEVYRENPRAANAAYLFKSGLNVGRDMVATMLNSLVLVFTGLALPMLMIFGIMEIPFLKVINFEFILITILSAAVSSIALIITVPATAAVTSRVLPRE